MERGGTGFIHLSTVAFLSTIRIHDCTKWTQKFQTIDILAIICVSIRLSRYTEVCIYAASFEAKIGVNNLASHFQLQSILKSTICPH